MPFWEPWVGPVVLRNVHGAVRRTLDLTGVTPCFVMQYDEPH